MAVPVRLHLVRHAHAAAGWDADPDPGLSGDGRAQADALAGSLGLLGPRPVLSSPLRRARHTAAPLAERWHADVQVVPAVGEIPSPTDDLAERGAWLRGVLHSRWFDQPAELRAWRDALVEALVGIEEDSVVVSHFVAINAVVGHCTADDRVVCFSPENASVTIVDVVGPGLRVVELGRQAKTLVR